MRHGNSPNTPPSRAGEDALSPHFEAVAEATEEAIGDSLLKAQTVRGRGSLVIQAIPIGKLGEIVSKARAMQ